MNGSESELSIVLINGVLYVESDNGTMQKVEAVFQGYEAINWMNRFVSDRGFEYTVHSTEDNELIILVNNEE